MWVVKSALKYKKYNGSFETAAINYILVMLGTITVRTIQHDQAKKMKVNPNVVFGNDKKAV